MFYITTLKVKYNDFTLKTRSVSLPKSTDDGDEIYSVVCRLLEKTEAGRRPIRFLGISVSELNVFGEQLSLFSQKSPKRKCLNRTLEICTKNSAKRASFQVHLLMNRAGHRGLVLYFKMLIKELVSRLVYPMGLVQIINNSETDCFDV